jgi:Ser/Thr protein kinase RdoA (MazF antagonist)
MSISTQVAVTAATSLAASLGLPGDDPGVLRDGSNVVVHLRPAPVVARVATVTALVRPGVEAWLTRDIQVARHLAVRGVPTTRPLDDAGPHHVDGIVVALWHHEPHDPSHTPAPAEVAALLADLHAALLDVDFELPPLGPFADLPVALDVLERSASLPSAALEALRAETALLARALAPFPRRPLHGDAHPGNLLATPSGLKWNDYEDTWLGPLGWDLACLATSGRIDGAAAVAAYPGPVDAEELAVCVRLRELVGVVWRFVQATRLDMP